MKKTYSKSEAIESPVSMEDMIQEALTNPGSVSDCYRQFHSYSFNNIMLAYCQCRVRGIAFGPISTFNGWKEKGRIVQKGQKAIILCQPVSFQKKDDNGPMVDKDGNKVMVTRFTYRKNWFVLSQTEGEDVEIPDIDGWDMELALNNLNILKGSFDYPDGNVMGYASGRMVTVSPLAVDPLGTLFHEIAHVVLGHTEKDTVMVDGSALDRGTVEAEAEMVAYLLRCINGYDEEKLTHSRGYIQSWLKRTSDQKLKDGSIQRVMKAVDMILKAGRSALVEVVSE